MPRTKQPLLLGAHTSVAGGFEQAIARGESIGCTCIQLFTKSNRQWNAKPISEEEAERFKKAVASSTIKAEHIVVHASYLINIGSSSPELEHKSIASLKEELQRCQKLGIQWLVLHPGSHVGMGEEGALRLIAQRLDQVLEAVPGNVTILLETMAGQGSTVCYSFEQIAQIIKSTRHHARIGVCADTCHLFAAGYDLRSPSAYHRVWDQFDQTIGLDHLKAIHLNDSLKELGSRVDRHADIGKGQLGLEAFRLLMNDSRFRDIPKLLETPETTEILKDYERNLLILRNLIDDKN